jgi:hypothetical protein
MRCTHVGGGTSGDDGNQCREECPRYCIAMPSAAYSPSLPKMFVVGLWPKIAYEQLGMYVVYLRRTRARARARTRAVRPTPFLPRSRMPCTPLTCRCFCVSLSLFPHPTRIHCGAPPIGRIKFFEAAVSMRKKKVDGAMEVAWSYCVGCNGCPVYGVHQIKEAGLDGANYEKFVADFAAEYGPGTPQYPVPPGVARVTIESRAGGAIEEGQSLFTHPPASVLSPFAAPEDDLAGEQAPTRSALGLSAEGVLRMLADPGKRIEDKAGLLVTSEYWGLLSKSYMPTQVVQCIESHMGGSKETAAAHKSSCLQRLVAAAAYDRISRRLQYESLGTHGDKLQAEIKSLQSLRQAVGSQLPDYPDDSFLHA